MSQAATLTRVSEKDFLQIKSAKERTRFNSPGISKGSSSFYTFMGLGYVLSKGQSKETADLISEIFEPTKMLGGPEMPAMDLAGEVDGWFSRYWIYRPEFRG